MHLPHEYLRIADSLDSLTASILESQRISRTEQSDSLNVDSAAGDEAVHVRRIRERYRPTGLEASNMQCRMFVVQADRAVIAMRGHPRREGDQATAVEFGVDVEFLIARSHSGFVRGYPHLDEVNGLGDT